MNRLAPSVLALLLPTSESIPPGATCLLPPRRAFRSFNIEGTEGLRDNCFRGITEEFSPGKEEAEVSDESAVGLVSSPEQVELELWVEPLLYLVDETAALDW